ncbi:MAG: citramalate synthase, partial [Paenibacillaceae bacterium]|nr:citramalate synthase [Paenibacillaceae bacterium]
ESTDYKSSWNTVGVSDNIIEASWQALVDSIRYALIGKERSAIAGDTPIGKAGLINH